MEQQQFSLHVEEQTVRELLEFVALFGPRYRLWQVSTDEARHAVTGQVWTPSALLTHLQHQQDSLVQRGCELVWREVVLQEKNVVVWGVSLLSPERPPEPTPYVIEDMLDVERVYEWLLHRDPVEPVAILQPEVECSTFLATYYRDHGIVQEGQEAYMPMWYAYIELLLHSLDPSEHREAPIAVGAKTLAMWMASISGAFWDGRNGLYDLEDDSLAPTD